MSRRRLTQSVESYLANEGWSSSKFLDHAKFLFDELPKYDIRIEVGRTVVYLHRTTRLGCDVVALKCYVHYQGASKEYLTVTDAKGNAIKCFYCECNPSEILDLILLKVDSMKEDDPYDYSYLNLFEISM